jgi:dTDP-4-amino-4,6-dideoxygalactose transaminase
MVLPSDQDSTGRTLDQREIELVSECIGSGTLTSTKGNFTKTFEKKFASMIGVGAAYACASGSAAIHCAIAAVDPEPGDEIITSPITDMGALTPIVYQGAVPVFCDVDSKTLNVTAETIAKAVSPRTKAIVITHLFGNPCEMAGIVELGAKHGIPVIEDCAQAFLARCDGRYVGTIGSIGCFSLQQGKHMTTGEGGIVTSNDPALARRMFLFINKAWGYGDPNPDHYFLALNYRISELQGAVALGQLEKLEDVVRTRMELADKLTQRIQDLPGLSLPIPAPGSSHVYWKYCPIVDSTVIRGGAVALAKELKERGIASAPRYIQKPAFECQVFKEQRTFGKSRFPFTLARPEAVDYDRAKFPGTFAGLEGVLVLPWNERYTDEHIDYIANGLREGVEKLCIR